PLIASSATFALNSAEYRFRFVLLIRGSPPRQSFFHLTRLSEFQGPPLYCDHYRDSRYFWCRLFDETKVKIFKEKNFL
ncbi:hypothetical protein, partial [Candidatus Deferrimicrobium sp.]|uniref:hypothetical protein n=1 Tax=Candidatus Deferrimicrobium sp. TaxID=3060586 RepID=UPI002ED44C01